MAQHRFRGIHSLRGIPLMTARAVGVGGWSSTCATELLSDVVMVIIECKATAWASVTNWQSIVS